MSMTAKNKRVVTVGLCLVLLCAASSAVLTAQTSVITGKLGDSSGNMMTGITARAVRAGTGEVYVGTMDKDGTYTFTHLLAGTYALQFSADGHKTTEVEGVVVGVADALIINQTLGFGSMSEKTVVPWVAVAGEGNSSTAGNPPEDNKVKNLPLSTRNFTQAAGLSAGVAGQVANATNVGINTLSSHVGSGNNNNYSMDGISVASSLSGAATPGIPNPDAIQKNDVKSWTYDAGAGVYGGANIGVVTKSGLDAFHGTLFEFIRNDIFNANDYFLKRKGLAKPVLKQNQFGATFGGPLRRGRLYFFGSYQGTRQSNGIAASGYSPNVTLPPLPASRTAANVAALYCGSAGYFGGVQIACDGSNINPVALSILNLKLANGSYYIPGSSNGSYQAVPYSIPAKFQEDQFLINTDLNITDKHRIAERFYYARDPQVSNFTGAIQQGPSSLPGAPSDILTGNISGLIRLTSTLSSRLSNEMRISGQHYTLKDTPHLPFTNDEVGITSVVSAIDVINIINISGLFNLGGNGIWDSNSTNQYQLGDQMAWTHGLHAIRAGIEVDRRQWNASVLGDARGALTFMSFSDFLLGLPGCPPGNSSCSPDEPVVDGTVTNGSSFSNVYASSGPNGFAATVTEPDGINHSYRYSDIAGFAQDDIKLISNLTLNVGLRWEYFSQPLDTTGNLTTFWPSLTAVGAIPPASGTYEGFVVPSNFKGTLATGVYRNPRETPIPTKASMTNFAPRLSFAWLPLKNPGQAIRGGYGLFYDRPDAYYLEQPSLVAIPYATPVGGSGATNYQASFPTPYQSVALGWGKPRTVDFTAGTSSNLTLRMLDEHFLAPQTQKWNFEIQKTLPAKWIVTVGYAGSHSIREQISDRQINGAHLANSNSPVNGITQNTVKNAALRVPYLGIAPNGLDSEQTAASGKYNSLLATLTKQLSHGIQAQAIYTFSKFLSTISAGPGPVMNSNDPLNARQQYGPFSQTAPQRLALHYSWNLPYRGTGSKETILGGWSLSGVTIIQGGMPMTLTDPRGGTIYGNAGSSRAQFCEGKGPGDVPTSGKLENRLTAYFNSSAFCAPPVLGDDGKATGYGNSSVGFICGPNQNNTDLSVSKGINIRQSKMELRMEMFNAFNHPQFAIPNTSVTNPTFGEITSTSVNPRLIQLAVKYSF